MQVINGNKNLLTVFTLLSSLLSYIYYSIAYYCHNHSIAWVRWEVKVNPGKVYVSIERQKGTD